MYIVTRYVVAEVLKYFLAALVALTVIVTPVLGVKEGMSRGLPPMIVLQTIPFLLPFIFQITVPIAFLLAVCTVFGRMTGSNEIIALKSLGINPMAAIWPTIVLAAFLSLGTVCLFEIDAVWGKPNLIKVAADSIEKIAYSMLQKERAYEGEQFSIQVKRIDWPKTPDAHPTLVEPTIIVRTTPKITICAEEAQFETDWNQRRLDIRCYRGRVEVEGHASMSFSFPGEYKHTIPPLPAIEPPRYHRFYVATRDISGLVAELETTRSRLEGFCESRKALGAAESEEDNRKITDYRSDIRRLKAESYRRWSNGFTCLCFALIGMPVAMIWRHADVLTNFFVCFLPILAIYYPLFLLSDTMATSPNGHMPAASFWMANLVMAAPAIALIRWVVRH